MVRGSTLVTCLSSNFPRDEHGDESAMSGLPLVTSQLSTAGNSDTRMDNAPCTASSSCGLINEWESSRVKWESKRFFAEQDKVIARASLEAGAVLRQIEAEARERAGECDLPKMRKPQLLKLQAWGSFRDIIQQYAEILSSPSKAHASVAKEVQLLKQENKVFSGDSSLASHINIEETSSIAPWVELAQEAPSWNNGKCTN